MPWGCLGRDEVCDRVSSVVASLLRSEIDKLACQATAPNYRTNNARKGSAERRYELAFIIKRSLPRAVVFAPDTIQVSDKIAA